MGIYAYIFVFVCIWACIILYVEIRIYVCVHVPVRFNLKETRTRVRYMLLFHYSIGGQHTSAYWSFWMLEHAGLISSSAYSGFLITLLDVHLPT